MSEVQDGQWRALIAAEQAVIRLRAEFNHADGRSEIISQALASPSKWDRGAAIRFLRYFPDDVHLVLDQLVDLCLSIGWLVFAKEPIRAARSPSLLAKLEEVVSRTLDGADPQDYTNIADMLTFVEAWEILAKVLHRARGSEDPEIREVADDFTRSYGGMLPTR